VQVPFDLKFALRVHPWREPPALEHERAYDDVIEHAAVVRLRVDLKLAQRLPPLVSARVQAPAGENREEVRVQVRAVAAVVRVALDWTSAEVEQVGVSGRTDTMLSSETQ
jgi:hypothetical protein